MTLTDILQAEMTASLINYKQYAGDDAAGKDLLNHRYFCLQTALWLAGAAKQPAVTKSTDEVRKEIQAWVRQINREVTVQTMYTDGKRVELLNQFLETIRPMQPVPVQTTLL